MAEETVDLDAIVEAAKASQIFVNQSKLISAVGHIRRTEIESLQEQWVDIGAAEPSNKVLFTGEPLQSMHSLAQRVHNG